MIFATEIKAKNSGNSSDVPTSINVSNLFPPNTFAKKNVKDLSEDDLELIEDAILSCNSNIKDYSLTDVTTISLYADFWHDGDFRFSEGQIKRDFIEPFYSLLKQHFCADYTYTFTKSDDSITIYFAIIAKTDFAFWQMRDFLETLIVSVRTSPSKCYVLREIYDALEGLVEDMYKNKSSSPLGELFASLSGNYSESTIKLNWIQ